MQHKVSKGNFLRWHFKKKTRTLLLYLLYLTILRCCLLHRMKQNYLLKTFLRTLVLMTKVSLYLFSLLELIKKLHNISVTFKVVKNVIMNLNLWKASGPDCISLVVLKNCELELSYKLAELFNKFVKESCFPDFGEVSLLVPVFKNVGKGLQPKTMTLLVFFQWLVKSLKNL